MEQLAREQRDVAVAERDNSRNEMLKLRAQLERMLEAKEAEIALLRAKIPLDKWNAGWSEVMLRVSSNWGVRILADGSGIYGYGGKFDDFCTFPAGTFTFDKVRRDALARASLDGRTTSSSIELRRKNEQGAL